MQLHGLDSCCHSQMQWTRMSSCILYVVCIVPTQWFSNCTECRSSVIMLCFTPGITSNRCTFLDNYCSQPRSVHHPAACSMPPVRLLLSCCRSVCTWICQKWAVASMSSWQKLQSPVLATAATAVQALSVLCTDALAQGYWSECCCLLHAVAQALIAQVALQHRGQQDAVVKPLENRNKQQGMFA